MSGGMESLHCIDWRQNWKKRKQNSLKWSDQWYELLLCLAQSLGMEIFQNPQISPKKGDHIFWVKFSFCRFSAVGWGEMRNASAIGSVSTLLVRFNGTTRPQKTNSQSRGRQTTPIPALDCAKRLFLAEILQTCNDWSAEFFPCRLMLSLATFPPGLFSACQSHQQQNWRGNKTWKKEKWIPLGWSIDQLVQDKYSGRPPIDCAPYSHPLTHLFHPRPHLHHYKLNFITCSKSLSIALEDILSCSMFVLETERLLSFQISEFSCLGRISKLYCFSSSNFQLLHLIFSLFWWVWGLLMGSEVLLRRCLEPKCWWQLAGAWIRPAAGPTSGGQDNYQPGNRSRSSEISPQHNCASRQLKALLGSCYYYYSVGVTIVHNCWGHVKSVACLRLQH